jgi:membrane protease YdiL (CAAX protease family)
MKTSSESKEDNLSMIKVAFLIFVPTTILTASYFLFGSVFEAIPSLLLFFALATLTLFPIELAVVLYSSKKSFGSYSLRSAFANQDKSSWIKTLLYGVFLFGFAGIVSATVGPFEHWITLPLSNKLVEIMPAYYDWNNMEYLRQYPKNILLLTCIVYGIFNILVGPVVEELYFRGYLTSKLSRLGKWAPIIITVLFSLYHFWLPLQNLFRISAFLPAAYIAWKQKNLYISIVFHCLCNLISTIGFIAAVFAV